MPAAREHVQPDREDVDRRQPQHERRACCVISIVTRQGVVEREYWRSADIIPSGMPTRTAMRIAVPISASVGGIRLAISSAMGRCDWIE